MAKDRLRTEGWSKPAADCAHMSTARGCGADVMLTYANATLAYANLKKGNLFYKLNIL